VSEKIKIEPKDILDISWKYFQQHAQQRISYFNFFLVFAIFMTTCLLTTFQEKFAFHFVGIGIGVMQAFVSIMFLKIDNRNKFLTGLGENAIKELEKNYQINGLNSDSIKIFQSEERASNELKKARKDKVFVYRQLSHGKAFKHIYWFFIFIGISGALLSGFLQLYKTDSMDKKVEISEDLFKQTYKRDNNQIDFLVNKTKVLELDLKIANHKLDSIAKLLKVKNNTESNRLDNP
jgi:hypothetical protein